MNKIRLLYAFLLMLILMPSCTDLDEVPLLFSEIPLTEYYTDKNSVNAAVMRPYEHGHWCGWDGDRWYLQEFTADQFVWTQKGRHGWDDGQWVRLHEHNWDNIQNQIYGSWTGPYQGIGYINKLLSDFTTFDFTTFGVTKEEQKAYIGELRVLRVWYYTFLIDFFRHVPISESIEIETLKGQSTPQEVFDYMEKELKDVLEVNPALSKTPAIGRHGQASAAAILVRMYLNAKVWTGTDRSADCVKYAEAIIRGDYGTYSIDEDYRGPFQSFYNGKRSPENIFEWPHARNIYDGGWFYDAFHHYKAQFILGTEARGTWNGAHLTPSRDLEGNIYPHTLGKPYEKFADGDFRKQNYRVVDKNGTTEGFFLIGPQFEFDKNLGFGYTNKAIQGSEEYSGKNLVFVDQVGRFSEKPGGRWSEGSHVTTGEENSGVRLMKFGPLPLTGDKYFNNSIAEIRLAEIKYTLAECKYKAGDKLAAAKLLDEVRKRNFAAGDWSKHSYEANLAKLTDQEFIDEWGREFLGERRRRIDLIRWGRFGEAWWDKDQDKTDKDYEVFPIPYKSLHANPLLKQTTKGWE